MVLSIRILMLQGALAAFADGRSEYSPDLRAAGVTPEMFELLTRERVWRGTDLEKAKRALEGVLTCSMKISGINHFALTAEYIAACIVSLVNSANWQIAAELASRGLDGTKLIAMNGDEIESRETVSAERLYALVFVAWPMRGVSIDIVQSTIPNDAIIASTHS